MDTLHDTFRKKMELLRARTTQKHTGIMVLPMYESRYIVQEVLRVSFIEAMQLFGQICKQSTTVKALRKLGCVMW